MSLFWTKSSVVLQTLSQQLVCSPLSHLKRQCNQKISYTQLLANFDQLKSQLDTVTNDSKPQMQELEILKLKSKQQQQVVPQMKQT